MGIGLDCGTYNLVCAKRDEKNNIVCKREVNAFIEFPLKDRFVFNMMKNAVDEKGNHCVPLIEWEEAGVAYALGEAAVKFAYSMDQLELKRPMVSGCLNPKEKHAQQIMNIMVHGLIDSSQDKEKLYYSIPANAINEETDADYHSLVLKAMFDSFEDESGHKVDANPINEGLALVYAELGKKAYTGFGCSFGAGMINLCYSMFGAPVFQFSIVNSGDWIDKQAARVTGESIAFINQEKTTVNLTENPSSLVHKAIKAQYEIMIQKTVSEIQKGLEMSGNKTRSKNPIDFIIAGGTSSPVGFDKIFSEALRSVKLPVEIGEIIRPVDPLFSVARGCLLAAEAAVQG